jgi:ribosomal subunit interface protein
MDVRIKATDYQLTPETKAYLWERLEALRKLLAEGDELTRIEVELGRDAGRPRHGANIWFAEINVMQPGEGTIRATNRAQSINAAIDDVKEEVERQLRGARKLHIRLLRKSGAFAKRLLRFGGTD